jgi:hypothetical protein
LPLGEAFAFGTAFAFAAGLVLGTVLSSFSASAVACFAAFAFARAVVGLTAGIEPFAGVVRRVVVVFFAAAGAGFFAEAVVAGFFTGFFTVAAGFFVAAAGLTYAMEYQHK